MNQRYNASNNTAQATQAPSVTLIANACGRLSDRAAHLHGLVDRVQRVTNRVLGCEPTSASPPKDAGEPHCDAAQLDRAFEILDTAVARLEYEAARLERI